MVKRSTTHTLAPYLSAASTAAAFLPSAAITDSAQYQSLLTAAPGAPWFSAGFFLALWLFTHPESKAPPWSRAMDALFKKYDVDLAGVGNYRASVNKSEVQVRVILRFRRSGNFKIRMRIFEGLGRGRPADETVLDLGSIDAIKGQTYDLDVLAVAFPYAGWDHTRPYGWGPNAEKRFIPYPYNVAVIECESRLHTQKFAMAILHINHERGQQVFKPSIAVIREDDEIFDVSAKPLLGEWR